MQIFMICLDENDAYEIPVWAKRQTSTLTKVVGLCRRRHRRHRCSMQTDGRACVCVQQFE